jgi:hypothetical protein
MDVRRDPAALGLGRRDNQVALSNRDRRQPAQRSNDDAGREQEPPSQSRRGPKSTL